MYKYLPLNEANFPTVEAEMGFADTSLQATDRKKTQKFQDPDTLSQLGIKAMAALNERQVLAYGFKGFPLPQSTTVLRYFSSPVTRLYKNTTYCIKTSWLDLMSHMVNNSPHSYTVSKWDSFYETVELLNVFCFSYYGLILVPAVVGLH